MATLMDCNTFISTLEDTFTNGAVIEDDEQMLIQVAHKSVVDKCFIQLVVCIT